MTLTCSDNVKNARFAADPDRSEWGADDGDCCVAGGLSHRVPPTPLLPIRRPKRVDETAVSAVKYIPHHIMIINNLAKLRILVSGCSYPFSITCLLSLVKL